MSTKAELTSTNTTNSLAAEGTSLVIDAAFPKETQKQLAWADVQQGFKKWRIWLLLAYQDIKLRYRRSVLGPFWITLSMAITVYSMGFLYAHLFRVNMQDYYPFLVAGMLTWALISTVIIELTDAFIASEGLIKQIKLPYTVFVHRIATRNLLIFFHNVIVMLPIFFIFPQTAKINFNSLLILPGLLIIYMNSVIYGLILAMLGSRYRDVSQIIKSLIQVIFFVTPVMWSPAILPEQKRYFVEFNPFYSFLEVVRAPLIGNSPTLLNYTFTIVTALIGIAICLRLFVPYRARIIYWL